MIWNLKDDEIDFTIEWTIIKQSRSYRPGDKACLLCVDEKLFILENKENNKMINKDTTQTEKCPHKYKFLIDNWKNKS